jgi:uncharacterized protein YicC (UPF0701 family)
MTKFWRLLAVMLLSGLAIGASATEATGQQLTAWDRFKTYAHTEQEIAVQEGKKLIAATERQIADLKAKAKTSGKEVKAAYEADIKMLEAKMKEAQAHLDKMSKASASAWDSTKEGFSNAYRDLHQAYDKSVAAAKK